MADREFLQRLTRELADKGNLIEAGWTSMRLAVIPLDAGKAQLEDMRFAYFAGAQHAFASLLAVVSGDEEKEPTPEDMRRMRLIADELESWAEKVRAEGDGRGATP